MSFYAIFKERYLNLYDEISGAVKNYVSDVKQKNFPNEVNNTND